MSGVAASLIITVQCYHSSILCVVKRVPSILTLRFSLFLSKESLRSAFAQNRLVNTRVAKPDRFHPANIMLSVYTNVSRVSLRCNGN